MIKATDLELETWIVEVGGDVIEKEAARGRAALRLVFDVLSLIVTLVLVWQFARFEIISFKSGDVTSSNLMTPFWIPRALMVIGVAGLAVTLARTIRADLRRFRATASGRLT